MRHHLPGNAFGIAHHPEDDLLLAYASGASDEATALVIATHLAFCAQCRGQVDLMETIGGGLLESLPPAPLAETAFAATVAKLDMGLDSAPPYQRPARAPSRDRCAAIWAATCLRCDGGAWDRVSPTCRCFAVAVSAPSCCAAPPAPKSAPIPIAAWK
jgi:putative transcriptional regulator